VLDSQRITHMGEIGETKESDSAVDLRQNDRSTITEVRLSE